jgi:hypothetical protein
VTRALIIGGIDNFDLCYGKFAVDSQRFPLLLDESRLSGEVT